jgi:hypothetical protein
VAAWAAVRAGAVEVTSLPPPSGAGIERGVAVLRCATQERGIYWESRAAVLDVGAMERADVLLTTGHGLPVEARAARSDCYVIARGKSHPVQGVWRAANPRGGPDDDWAVLLTHGLPADIRRLRPADVSPDALATLVAERAPVRLVLRYAGESQSDCRLEPNAVTFAPLVSHSCAGHPGLSGTPLVAMVRHEPVVIAIHVGTQLEWDGARFDWVSVARVLDDDVATAIEAAAARARASTGHGPTR